MPQNGEESRGIVDYAVRPANAADVAAIRGLDTRITGMAKPDYWDGVFARYGDRPKRFFLVAEETGGGLLGFIFGEVRAWEFGSPPSGWIIGLGVDPAVRLRKVGTRMFDAITDRLAETGVDTVRTMLARDDDLNMAFFRSQGMMAGPFIQLEMPLNRRRGGEERQT